jgi:CheY-like chemotaxis protein
MDIQCPRCGSDATPAGHEDARAYFQCPNCNRVWATVLSSLIGRDGPHSKRGSVRILVVDDSDELRGLVTAWLEDEGYAVVTAGSGREALDAAAVYYPDIVILDLIIPPPDGFQVCEALRNHLPPQIILMTGLSDPEHVRRALGLGVVALLRKPLTREAVLDSVTIAAERCRRDPLSKLRWHFGMHPRV